MTVIRSRARGRIVRRGLTPVERFNACVEYEPNSGCWLWAGPTSGKYGCITVGGKGLYAHRWAYEHFIGPIPDGLNVCHRCDTPLCINPAHLFAGTQSVNILDAISKKRFKPPVIPGPEHHNSKLNAELVLMIRRDKRSSAKIARELGVSESAVVQARAGKTWRTI